MPSKTTRRKDKAVKTTKAAMLFAKIARSKPAIGRGKPCARKDDSNIRDTKRKQTSVPVSAVTLLPKAHDAGAVVESATSDCGLRRSFASVEDSKSSNLEKKFKQEPTDVNSLVSSTTSLLSNNLSGESVTATEILNVLERIENKVDDMARQQEKCLLLVAQANAKVDALASTSIGKATVDEPRKLYQLKLTPVKSFADLEAVEEQCKDDEFVDEVLRSIGSIHGKNRFKGNGGTVGHQVIDYFVDRRFLRQCSWTGISKTFDENQHLVRKVSFSKYERYINLIYSVIRNADEDYTMEKCHKFLKQCLRNSKQRLDETKMVRLPAARNRSKKNRKEYTEEILDGNEPIEEGTDPDPNMSNIIIEEEEDPIEEIIMEEYLSESS
ncbi:uncharacterized protein LOC134225116 [Armigeres subalbatus]|uniref:uncharacterized protein LOC134225116 n=1 Tax=Armigeres subalbatus TaxID=124917 RepID=UPI002ED52336